MSKRVSNGSNPHPPRRLRKAGGLLLAALAVVGLLHLFPAEPAAADSPATRSTAGQLLRRAGLPHGPAHELLSNLVRRQARQHDRPGHHHGRRH
ncbi:hypothetical protein [Streptomyces tateyamensis]|uniref:hypothetical protein n=1 Tax=Streptomyces tateyamensis TaxID=565073 RepID=UPI0015E8D123|nr:hypothetical protein [Streptomyces tateyamensis]